MQEVVVFYALDGIPLRFYADNIELGQGKLTLFRGGAMIANFESYIYWYVNGSDKKNIES